jgi:hypothetical protein
MSLYFFLSQEIHERSPGYSLLMILQRRSLSKRAEHILLMRKQGKILKDFRSGAPWEFQLLSSPCHLPIILRIFRIPYNTLTRRISRPCVHLGYILSLYRVYWIFLRQLTSMNEPVAQTTVVQTARLSRLLSLIVSS